MVFRRRCTEVSLSVLYKVYDSINLKQKGSAMLVMAVVAAALAGFMY